MICYKSYVAEREQETTGRSGVLVGRWRSNPQVVCSRLDSALPFSYVDVGDAFQFINNTFQFTNRILDTVMNIVCTEIYID